MKVQKIKLVCQWCNASFEVYPCRKLTAKFCGWTCKQKAGAKIANEIIVKKYRGTGSKTYVKFMGRHEHRVIAEKMLGRPLVRGEIVHHINENKKDNRPENLQVMTQSKHASLHFKKNWAERKRAQA